MNNDGQDLTPPIPSSSEVSLGVRIDRICSEFEELLKAGKTPPIEFYLSQLPTNEHATLLEELLGLELDYRARAGDSFTSEEYTLRFPEHASKVAELVVNVRQQKPIEPHPDDEPQAASPQNSPGSAHTTQRSHAMTRPVRIGPYEILEACGRGGMGVVYKAWHEFFKQYRAIKVLPSHFDEDDINRFAMEIKIAGQLNHHNIVRAYEANREHGILYLAMEFVDGINLDQLVKHHKRLPVGMACEMIRQAAEGLQHADDHDLVHRDIKPSNLMINRDGEIKILDFGLARLQADQNASRLTKHGSVMGTLDFMAPEQWEDPMGATIQADIYSLGCTLYYLITGNPPYSGEHYSHWIKKQEAHRKQPVPKLDHEQSKELQPILNRMMAKSRWERYESPAEIAEALKPFSDVSELKTYGKTPAPRVPDSNFSHTPIPTIHMPGSDLRRHPGEAFEDDSEVNSKEKTIRPHQSRTDVESGHHQASEAQPSKPTWYQSRMAWISLAVLAVVLFSGAWLFFRPAQNIEFAEQMGALPGLNGGLNGDWWFAEMPWYGPGIRKTLMEAVRRGETQIAGISLEELKLQLPQADTQKLQDDLSKIADELKTRLPDREQSLAGQILTLNRETPNYEDNLLKVLPESYRAPGELDESDWENATPTELHLLANLLHHNSTNNSTFAILTEQVYQRAIKAYDEDDEVESVLEALAHSDYSRFLSGRRNYSKGIHEADLAAAAVPHAALFQISLRCDLADQYRKRDGDSTQALAQLTGDPHSAKEWAEKMGLAEKHPLQAEILERKAWINVDGWHMEQALQDFEKATLIRKANQEKDNSFAWRPILLNMQGQAMALHFLGRDEDYEDKNGNQKDGANTVYAKLIQTINKPPQGLPYGTKTERDSRLPNIHERHGDVYLFDYTDKDNYGQAEEEYRQAAQSAHNQGFRTSATLWFHLTRLYYKHALALILQGELEEASENPEKEAQQLEADFQRQMEQEAFENQSSAFALEKKVASDLKKLKQVEQGSQPDDSPEMKAVLGKLIVLIEGTDKTSVKRGNIEVLLLVFHELFDRHKKLEPKDVNGLAYRLLAFTEPMLEGDPAITNVYLRPVLERAYEAIDQLPTTKQDRAVKELLKSVLPEPELSATKP